MKVIVCGGRDFNDRDRAFAALDKFHAKHPIKLVISGGAAGADTLGEAWALARGIHYAVVKALWDALGRKAGPLRNRAMLTLAPGAVIAFPGGTGTAHMVASAVAHGVKVWKIP